MVAHYLAFPNDANVSVSPISTSAHNSVGSSKACSSTIADDKGPFGGCVREKKEVGSDINILCVLFAPNENMHIYSSIVQRVMHASITS